MYTHFICIFTFLRMKILVYYIRSRTGLIGYIVHTCIQCQAVTNATLFLSVQILFKITNLP